MKKAHAVMGKLIFFQNCSKMLEIETICNSYPYFCVFCFVIKLYEIEITSAV